MNNTISILEFNIILQQLADFALTDAAKDKIMNLRPYMSQDDVTYSLRDTSEARLILDNAGAPPLVSARDVTEMLTIAKQGGMLTAEQLEYIAITLAAVERLKSFLHHCRYLEAGIAFYDENLNTLDNIRNELEQCIRSGRVEDSASSTLKDVRKDIMIYEDKIKAKADSFLRSNKDCLSDSFVVLRNGHLCLPVKKEYRYRIDGSVIDKSSKGSTLFIEPASITDMNSNLSLLKIEEENEVRTILYRLSDMVACDFDIFMENIRIIEKLDFIFAKGKLSAEMDAVCPTINTSRKIHIEQGRHPLMNKSTCVPLDFDFSDGINGVIITGPNTGGKTVCIKTIGLFSMMAQCGLHVPGKSADLCMHDQILCDIGDGQNITENLSTFSSHITNVMNILNSVTKDSLVLMDELGSGTDPTEGMGIAIAVINELIQNDCLFMVTTHYPEVKNYAEATDGIMNARMAFDPESLKPLYRLELGKSGNSCALYIASRLGMPDRILHMAYDEAYHDDKNPYSYNDNSQFHIKGSAVKKHKDNIRAKSQGDNFNVGDCVMLYPDKKLAIVCEKCDDKGNIQIQLKGSKIFVNQKRLKLHVAADQLYPEDYDFSIVFDSVTNRKARHQMNRKFSPDLTITDNK